MTTSKTIKKDYLWNTVGVLAQNAISPLLLIVVTRINGINDSGLFSYAFSIAIIFWTLAMWGGRTYQVSDVKQEFSHRSYIMVRLLLSGVVLLGAVMFSVANHYDAMKTSVILALVLFKVIESIADAVYGIMQVNDRLYLTGKSLIYKAVGGFFIFAVIDVFTKDVLLGSLGVVAVNMLILFLYDLRIARTLEKIGFEIKRIKGYCGEAVRIMLRCWPVFIVAFLAVFSLNIPRYFIDLYHQDQIGYFGIIAMPITLIVLIMTFILQPNIVQLSRLYDKRQYTAFNGVIARLAGITFIVGLTIIAGIYLVGVQVLQIVFNVDFSDYKLSLIIIMIGAIANALVSILINVFIIMRRFKEQFYILLLTNCGLAAISMPIVKSYGLLGGVWLFTAVNFVQIVLFYGTYKMYMKKAAEQ